MNARRVNDEVYVADEPIVKVTCADVERLKRLTPGTRRRRVRLCAHRRNDDRLHEMLIVLGQGGYVRPHRHLNKSESFHVIDGALTVVVFTDAGQVREAIRLGSYGSARPFYYRLDEPAYHTVLLEAELAVVHETTNGPFDRLQTQFAPWAPAEEDAEAGRHFLADLQRQLGGAAA
jgi:cupin fold WbuC family metalloprotein